MLLLSEKEWLKFISSSRAFKSGYYDESLRERMIEPHQSSLILIVDDCLDIAAARLEVILKCDYGVYAGLAIDMSLILLEYLNHHIVEVTEQAWLILKIYKQMWGILIFKIVRRS